MKKLTILFLFFSIVLGAMSQSGDFIIRIDNGPSAIYRESTKQYDLYDPHQKKIEHNYNIRFAKRNKDYCIVLLVDNDLLWLRDSNIEKTKLPDHFFSDHYAGVCDYGIPVYVESVNNTKDTISLKRMYIANENREETYFSINNQSDIDSLFFKEKLLNQRFYDFSGDQYVLLGKKKNGKYNLYHYRENDIIEISENKADSLGIKSIYPNFINKYFLGKLKLEPQLKEDADSIIVERGNIYFKNNELCGVYRTNDEAKYKELGIERAGNLIRYVKPDGEEGWLDMDTGVEYADIFL